MDESGIKKLSKFILAKTTKLAKSILSKKYFQTGFIDVLKLYYSLKHRER